MSRILPDTHLLLWAVAEPGKLSKTTRKRLGAAEVFIGATSIWEVSIKVGLERLQLRPT